METTTTRYKRSQTKLQRARDLAARASSLQPSDPSLRRGLHAGISVVLVLGVGLAVVAGLGDFPESGLGRYVPTALLVPMIRMAMAAREGVPKRITLASVACELALFLERRVLIQPARR